MDDQQKLILYQNAVDYAKAHNLQLGQALMPEQLAALDKPMLWYVTQQVPDPNCMSGACPMVSALVPQLKQNMSTIGPRPYVTRTANMGEPHGPSRSRKTWWRKRKNIRRALRGVWFITPTVQIWQPTTARFLAMQASRVSNS
ncbi:hypothetical protein CJO79_23600 (plasmid) [Ralstonia solanacearum]|nr:hypothetical protein [Ralstonia solanacearum]AXV79846.1 hypothetical protein CJO76_23620 [Ralstonia solanacearum]AXV93879.1 hypothetical protein CJO79_23600 [Ralstonia solanacearum]AXW21865.1 hypothetical protein CJO85_23725 [Ralstonia solanacearum]AXW78773.1 hypothetical protein CJO97_23605 [Ralstonia solanacearum]